MIIMKFVKTIFSLLFDFCLSRLALSHLDALVFDNCVNHSLKGVLLAYLGSKSNHSLIIVPHLDFTFLL